MELHHDSYASLGGFKKIEAPLRRIDPLVDEFASEIHGKVERNPYEVAMRYISVARGRIHRAIQIMTFMAGAEFRPGPDGVEYGVIGHAWLDQGYTRYGWSKQFARWPCVPRSQAIVRRVLDAAWRETREVRKRDMTMRSRISRN